MGRTVSVIVITAIVTTVVMLFVVRNTTFGVSLTSPQDACELTGGTWGGTDLGAMQSTGGVCLWGEQTEA